MKIIKIILVCLILTLTMFINSVSASEVTGTISTGLTGNVNNTLTGTVVVPTTGSSPSGGGGGGGGSSVPPPTNQVMGILNFNSLIINWGKTGSNNTADFTGDGKVDILDFNYIIIHWGK